MITYLWAIMRMALRGVVSNKMRSMLTMLGIIIGVGAVIALVSVSEGAKKMVMAEFDKMGGPRLIWIYRPDGMWKDGRWQRNRDAEFLMMDDVKMIEDTCDHVTDAVPEVSTWPRGNAFYQGRQITANVKGTIPEFSNVRKWTTQKGRFLNQLDVDESLKVCVIGHKINENLFAGEEAVGKELRHNGLRYIVIGVMEEMGGGMSQGFDNSIFVPYTTVFSYNRTDRRLDSITCLAVSFKDSETAIEEIKSALALVHGSEDYFAVESPAEAMEGIEMVTLIIKLLLGGIASIALLVGGIGIMNIMLVSVTERTREIGIRKAVGARRRDILGQFLIEAVTLSVSGGVIGIAAGAVLAWAISKGLTIGWDKIDHWPFVLSLESVVVSTAFAVAVGVIFGVYPALKASRLHPVDALRYE